MPNITPEAWAANNSINTSSPGLNETATDIGDLILSQTVGSAELGGLFVMGVFALALWKADVSTDVSAVILVPLTFVLSLNGLLPLGNSMIDATLLTAATIFAYGFAKYMFR